MTLYVFFSFVAFLLYAQAAFYFLRALPKSKVNVLFSLKLLSLAWVSIIIFLTHFTNQLNTVYLLDRLGVFGWLSFPVLVSSFFYSESNLANKRIEFVIRFCLLPIALAILLRYQYHPESLKMYYQGESGIWYFKTNIRSFWTILSIIYLATNTAIVFYSARIWLLNTQNSIYNKEKIKAIVVFLSLLVFAVISLVSHIVLPLFGKTSVPAMIHIAALPVIAGLFFTIVITHPKTFFSEMISQIFIRRINEYVFYLDHNGYIYSVNQYTAESLGYSVSEFENREPWHFFKPPAIIKNGLKNAAAYNESQHFICYLAPKHGDPIPVSISARKVHDVLNNMIGFLIIASDYRQTNALNKAYKQKIRIETKLRSLNLKLEEMVRAREISLNEAKNKLRKESEKQKQTEKKIIRELRAKEEILREIHHRVKNNMQMIVSLVNIEQSNNNTTQTLKNAFGGLASRIRDISVIHDYLYDSPYMGKINFSKFIVKTADELASRQPDKKNVFFNVSLSDDEITIDQAIPCGIVVYELISNSLNDACRPAKTDKNNTVNRITDNPVQLLIHIEFYCEADRFFLVVRDNGSGMPMINEQPKQKNTGLTLVEILVNNYLNGDIHYHTDNGTTVSVSFAATNNNRKYNNASIGNL